MDRIGLVEESKRIWRTILSDNAIYNAVVQLTLVATAILVLVALIPRFADEVLDTGVDNVALVFAPAGLGLQLVNNGSWYDYLFRHYLSLFYQI